MRAVRTRGRSRVMLSHGIGWLVAGAIARGLWRFSAGQVVLRPPGKWDARWRTWAVAPPEGAELTRAEGIPRSQWARRPGWHRQVARLAAIAVLLGALVAPGVTVAVLAVAATLWLVRRALAWRDLAYYQRVCGNFLEWTAQRIAWSGVNPDPREWIELPPYTWEWVPLTPVQSALVRADSDDARDGWLVRWCPALARRLDPLTVPVAEWGWVRWLVDLRPDRPWVLARLLGNAGRGLVRAGEASRRARVRPRLITPDLANPDAQIVIHYPPTYQSHKEDVSEVERVVCERLPDGPWKFRRDAEAMTITVFHPTRLPTRVVWTPEEFASYSVLDIPIGEAAEGRMRIDLKGATPHTNASGKTGRGKSVTFLVIMGCFLYHGGHLVIVDPKRVDFVLPFRGLGNVDLVTVKDRFPGSLEDVVREMERRYEIIEEFAARAEELGMPRMKDNAELYFQPLMLAIDEKSGFSAVCRAWWKREGGGVDGEGNPKPGKGDPPTVEWERDVVARGRAAAVYGMTAAQQNSIPGTFPDTDIRSNYQYKILAGPADFPSWVVTFPGEKRRTLSSDVKGRAIVGVGSDLHETQLAYMDQEHVREAAQHGLTVRDAANLERAEMLAKVTGRPRWEVSPLPWWVPVPAETTEDVQGHPAGLDTPADAPADLSSAGDRTPLALVTETEGETPAQEVGEAPDNIAAKAADETQESNTSSSEGGELDEVTASEMEAPAAVDPRFQGPARAVRWINGNRAAAEFLSEDVDTFLRARTRARKRGEEVPGMVKKGNAVHYDADKLAEWWNQRPGSGRKAS